MHEMTNFLREKVEERNPGKLKPLPAEQGFAVTLKYEQGVQDRKKGPARGDKSADTSAAEPEGAARLHTHTGAQRQAGARSFLPSHRK